MVLGHLGAVHKRGSGAKTARFEREALAVQAHLVEMPGLSDR